MARLTSLAAILATVLLLVVNTYAIRTTIPTVENIAEVTNPRYETMVRCREQILGGFYPSSCMLYMIRSEMKMAYEPMCCMEMRFLDDECHCEALEQLLVDLKIYGGKRVDMEDAEERAMNIPVYCNLKERCRIHIM